MEEVTIKDNVICCEGGGSQYDIMYHAEGGDNPTQCNMSYLKEEVTINITIIYVTTAEEVTIQDNVIYHAEGGNDPINIMSRLKELIALTFTSCGWAAVIIHIWWSLCKRYHFVVNQVLNFVFEGGAGGISVCGEHGGANDALCVFGGANMYPREHSELDEWMKCFEHEIVQIISLVKHIEIRMASGSIGPFDEHRESGGRICPVEVLGSVVIGKVGIDLDEVTMLIKLESILVSLVGSPSRE
ncbi:hypothetical protein HAX54_033500 [Datura stramonium]|uniref:Uncharacterized protein n=1 Tax=Datura stramonium TaxID=4076 RepID=A0ABS8VDM6_DATST|nr:hypothetical protein [Datura stramonium]